MSRIRISIALGAAAAGLLLAGCSSSTPAPTPSSEAPSVPAASTPATTGAGYTAEIQQTFVSNCVTSATSGGTAKADAEAICGCIYKGIEAKVPFEEFVAADEAAAKGGGLPESWATITQSCQQDPAAF